MNEWQIITGKVEDFNARISSLQAESASLTTTTGEQIGSLTASVSGYFVSELDGYEGLYDYNAAEDLTVEDLQEGENAGCHSGQMPRGKSARI